METYNTPEKMVERLETLYMANQPSFKHLEVKFYSHSLVFSGLAQVADYRY